MRGKKIKNSFATYVDLTTLNNECDLIEVSNILLNWGNIPKTLGDVRAFEISLLAQAYLRLLKERYDRT